MTLSLRKLILTSHVTTSVACIGAVCGFLALALMGMVTGNDQAARSAYMSMEVIAWFAILPLIVASLVTGVVQSLGSEWGLFRHYWIAAKLGINVFVTAILLMHMRPIAALARAAKNGESFDGGLSGLQMQLVANAVAAAIVLVIATALSIYKPRGLTPYGRRILTSGRAAAAVGGEPTWVKSLGLLVIVSLLIGVLLHLMGRSLALQGG